MIFLTINQWNYVDLVVAADVFSEWQRETGPQANFLTFVSNCSVNSINICQKFVKTKKAHTKGGRLEWMSLMRMVMWVTFQKEWIKKWPRQAGNMRWEYITHCRHSCWILIILFFLLIFLYLYYFYFIHMRGIVCYLLAIAMWIWQFNFLRILRIGFVFQKGLLYSSAMHGKRVMWLFGEPGGFFYFGCNGWTLDYL